MSDKLSETSDIEPLDDDFDEPMEDNEEEKQNVE